MLGKRNFAHNRVRPKPHPNGSKSLGSWQLYEDDEGNLVAYNHLSDRKFVVATQFESVED